MLTKKQYELLMFIHERIRESGVPPSFDEMKEALDLRSKSGIHRLITALEERGFLRRMAHRARALEVVRLPDNAARSRPASPRASRPFTPSVIAGSLREQRGDGAMPPQARTVSPAAGAAANDVPVLGRIAAGTPIEAIQHKVDSIVVPPDIVRGGEHFALEVVGDSMINAGILDGDVVILQRTDNAQNGDIVCALVDDQEATLKRLRRRGDSVALEAANPAYETRIFGPDRVRVQGRLVGLIRRY